jgi:hypothetical protein
MSKSVSQPQAEGMSHNEAGERLRSRRPAWGSMSGAPRSRPQGKGMARLVHPDSSITASGDSTTSFSCTWRRCLFPIGTLSCPLCHTRAEVPFAPSQRATRFRGGRAGSRLIAKVTTGTRGQWLKVIPLGKASATAFGGVAQRTLCKRSSVAKIPPLNP